MPRLFRYSLIALAVLTLPAAAAPVQITVPGGELPNPHTERPYGGFPDDQTSRDILWNDYWTPDRLGLSFDGARAAIEAEAIAHPRVHYTEQWNPTLAATIARTGESFATHWERCQVVYAGYDIVSDTYSAGGVPQACRL